MRFSILTALTLAGASLSALPALADPAQPRPTGISLLEDLPVLKVARPLVKPGKQEQTQPKQQGKTKAKSGKSYKTKSSSAEKEKKKNNAAKSEDRQIQKDERKTKKASADDERHSNKAVPALVLGKRAAKADKKNGAAKSEEHEVKKDEKKTKGETKKVEKEEKKETKAAPPVDKKKVPAVTLGKRAKEQKKGGATKSEEREVKKVQLHPARPLGFTISDCELVTLQDEGMANRETKGETKTVKKDEKKTQAGAKKETKKVEKDEKEMKAAPAAAHKAKVPDVALGKRASPTPLLAAGPIKVANPLAILASKAKAGKKDNKNPNKTKSRKNKGGNRLA
ncbi:hypothetical protein JCM11641_005562 [Rhodosporidiobolus odoratus]